MKFFNNIQIKPLKSNYQQVNWAYLYGVQGTPEPSHRLNYQYSKHRNQLPKNADPNNVASTQEILVVSDENSYPSNVLPNYSRSKTADIQYAGARDLCSQRLSKFLHSPNCKLELSNHDNGLEHRQLAHGSDISLSIPNAHLSGLHYENYDGIHSQCKDTKFIETESSRNKIAGFQPITRQ